MSKQQQSEMVLSAPLTASRTVEDARTHDSSPYAEVKYSGLGFGNI